MAYKGTNDEGEEFTGGKPSPQEESMSEANEDAANGEYNPDEHDEDYIMRM